MKKRGGELANLILEQGAYVYICGDGNKMAKDVEAAIVELLVCHGSGNGVTSESDAKAILADMRQRRRFVLDIWS
jgi:sulfite reductase alpha subunit-like flavoprotein